MSTSKPGISVIICCYNSALRLPETLKHLARQVIPDHIPWEILVVDNASKDNTAETAYQAWANYRELVNGFRVIAESNPGLSYAREKGAKESAYDYLIFCDDDNWLDPNYLHNAFSLMESNTQIGALGGKSSAVTDAPDFPGWFESLQNGYAVGPQSSKQGDVSKICTLWGAGLITRKNLFLQSFPQLYPSIMTDRMGDSVSSGGDTEFCMRLLLKGFKLYYDERLTFIHFIPKERLANRERTIVAPKHIMDQTLEMNNYSLLFKLISTSLMHKPLFIVKIFLGYLSTFAGRKSWSIKDVKIIIYFYTLLDLGVSAKTKRVYNFYNKYAFKNESVEFIAPT